MSVVHSTVWPVHSHQREGPVEQGQEQWGGYPQSAAGACCLLHLQREALQPRLHTPCGGVLTPRTACPSLQMSHPLCKGHRI